MTGTRAKPWLPAINQHERNTRAALIDPRPEPEFWPTLGAFIRRHPRTWRVSVTLTAGIVLAQIGSMI